MAGKIILPSTLRAITDPASVSQTTDEAPVPSRFTWATVVTTVPLTIQLDGDSQVLGVVPETLMDPTKLVTGARVWTQIMGRRVVVLGTTPQGRVQPNANVGPYTFRSINVADAQAAYKVGIYGDELITNVTTAPGYALARYYGPQIATGVQLELAVRVTSGYTGTVQLGCNAGSNLLGPPNGSAWSYSFTNTANALVRTPVLAVTGSGTGVGTIISLFLYVMSNSSSGFPVVQILGGWGVNV